MSHVGKAFGLYGLTPCDDWIRADRDPGIRVAGREEFRDIWASRAGRPDGLVILGDMHLRESQQC